MKNKKSTIILFGANGFIGGAIADSLKLREDITLFTPNRKQCNLLKFREVKSYIHKIDPDIIINAAYIEVNSNVKPTKKYLNDNLKISNYILKASKGHYSIQRIIYFGSGLEYGDSVKPINENHTANPKNYYAKTKAIQSDVSLKLAKKFKLPLVLIKPFNLYGPHDTKSVFYYVIKSALLNNEFSITKGEQIRDILYIEDLVDLIEKIIDNGEKISSGEVINVGFGKGILLKDAIKEILRQTSFKKYYTVRDYRQNEYFSQVVDINKANNLLGWKPITSLEDGLKKTISWVKSVVN